MTLENYPSEVDDRLKAEALESLTRIANSVVGNLAESLQHVTERVVADRIAVSLVYRALVTVRGAEREHCAKRCELLAKFKDGAGAEALLMAAKNIRSRP
jgi:hypothetical protein